MAKQEVAQQVTPTDLAINNKFIDQLGMQLREKEKLGLSFPKNYSVENALNAAYLMLQDMTVSVKSGNQYVYKKALEVCTKQSIASTLLDMTVQALNPVKKQCYFIKIGDKLTLRRSYQGTMAVAKRCGVKTIVADVIYEGDTFKYHKEYGVNIFDSHEQDFENIDDEKIKGAYAILTMEDGSRYMEIMNINQIRKAWKKGDGYKKELEKNEGVHLEFADQMAKKTVITRACKNFINSSDDSDILDAFNSTTENEDLDQVQENVAHDIEVNANAVDFTEVVEQEEVEKCEGEVVEETPVNADAKGTDEPDWVN